LAGRATTRFIDETPELFRLVPRRDRATKLLTYIGEQIVNQAGDGRDMRGHARVPEPPVPQSGLVLPAPAPPPRTRDKLRELGPERFAAWLRSQKRLLVTDTTMRDAHQSLLATRMRTFDMLAIAPTYAARHADFFSLEMWGGATFDTAYRFLKESP